MINYKATLVQEAALIRLVLPQVANKPELLAYAVSIIPPILNYGVLNTAQDLAQPNPLTDILKASAAQLGRPWHSHVTTGEPLAEAFARIALYAGTDGKAPECSDPEKLEQARVLILSGNTSMFEPTAVVPVNFGSHLELSPETALSPKSLPYQGRVVHSLLTSLANKPRLMAYALSTVWPYDQYDCAKTMGALIQTTPVSPVLNALAKQVERSFTVGQVYYLAADAFARVAYFAGCDIREGEGLRPSHLSAVCRYIGSSRTDMFHPR